MKFEIEITRPRQPGGIRVINFDDDFECKITSASKEDRANKRFRNGLYELVAGIETLLPEETRDSFEISIRVKGEMDSSTGEHLRAGFITLP